MNPFYPYLTHMIAPSNTVIDHVTNSVTHRTPTYILVLFHTHI